MNLLVAGFGVSIGVETKLEVTPVPVMATTLAAAGGDTISGRSRPLSRHGYGGFEERIGAPDPAQPPTQAHHHHHGVGQVAQPRHSCSMNRMRRYAN